MCFQVKGFLHAFFFLSLFEGAKSRDTIAVSIFEKKMNEQFFSEITFVTKTEQRKSLGLKIIVFCII